jgi:glutaredoxin
MEIQLLYFEGCPGYTKAEAALREVLAEEGIEAEIEKINIESEEEAKKHGFLGSPTIRINGLDVEPAARGRRDAGMRCRVYFTEEGMLDHPPREILRAAIREAL